MAVTKREIVTLQFGHYSNYVGTHWWNCQEAGFDYSGQTLSEIDHDVLFREGQTKNGQVTFTPRLLLVDLKGTLGTLPEDGGLYEEPPIPDPFLPLWPRDKVDIQVEPRQEKNEFLQDLDQSMSVEYQLPNGLSETDAVLPKVYHLDNSVKTWSDFLRVRFHPRTITIINQYQHNITTQPFNTFDTGETLWRKPDFSDDFTDYMRLYIEESDNLQGFQVLLDCYNGFAGLSSACLQHLQDEYPSKAILAFPCLPAAFPESSKAQISTRAINMALSVASLSELSSLFAPLSCAVSNWPETTDYRKFQHLDYEPSKLFHSSAVLASALDTLTLLYRLRENQSRLADLTRRLNVGGRCSAAASLCFPFAMYPQYSLLQTLEEWNGPLYRSITPNCELDYETTSSQTLCVRGVPKSRLTGDLRNVSDTSNPAYQCRTVAEMVHTYLSFCGSRAPTVINATECMLPTSSPFPNIFSQNIMPDGSLGLSPRPDYVGAKQVGVISGLHSTPSVGTMLQSLHSETKKVNMRTLNTFSSSTLESTELSEVLEQLLCLSECYSEHIDI